MRLLVVALLFSLSAFAFEVPAFKPNVVDTSGALNPEVITRLNTTIQQLHTNTSVRPAVLLVNTIDDYSIEEAAEKTFKQWALGEQGKDNGLLIILAIQDRQMRIEVGYGLEGDLPDYFCAQVIHQIMKPQFREGKFEEGITLALNEIMAKMKGASALPASEPELMESPDFKRGVYIAAAWIVLFFLLPACIQTLGLIIAALTKPKAYQLFRKKKQTSLLTFMLGANSGQTVFLKMFFLINPGIFFVLFPIVFSDEPGLVYGLHISAALFIFFSIYFSVQNARMLFSERLMRRHEARRRLNVFRNSKTPGSTYTMFGRTYTAPTRSSSSRGSSGGFSSSSGGGRSGGGGASGSW